MISVSRCGVCGAFLQTDDRFCWSCGSRVEEVAAAPAAGREVPRPASEIDPETALLMRRAHLAQQRGDLDEAERLIREALERGQEEVAPLSMLAWILRAKGDMVGSVAAAQRVSEMAAVRSAPPGAVLRAREDRAEIEQQIVREVGGLRGPGETPISLFGGAKGAGVRSREAYMALAALGLIALLLAMVAAARGQWGGYLWFGVSLFAAGWCYNDAESRRQAALLWAPFVLCLGPFGLAIYLLATH